MSHAFNYFFAADTASYSCGTYGGGAYGEDCVASTGGQPSPASPGNGGLLPDTGWNILLPVALGLSIVIASVILLVKQLRRRKQTTAR